MAAILHSAVLAIANLSGIWLGFLVVSLARGAQQLSVQLPVAVVVSIVTFRSWVAWVDARAPETMGFRRGRDGAWAYGLAPFWAAVSFVPLHFVTQGYLTAFSNVLALWAFQLSTNLLVVALSGGREAATSSTSALGGRGNVP